MINPLEDLQAGAIGAMVQQMVLAFLLARLVIWHYGVYGSSLSNKRQFSGIFPIITLTVVVVISVVKSSLALSLGLVGALSIVRFRTPIKDPEELAYLFLCIAIGLGAGAEQLVFTGFSVLFILLVTTVVKGAPATNRTQNFYLSVDSPGTLEIEALSKEISAGVSLCDIRRVDRDTDRTRLSFHVQVDEPRQLFALVEGLGKTRPDLDFTLVEQQRVPGV